MFQLYGGALLYLVPVVVAAVVAYVITRPDKDEPAPAEPVAPVIPMPVQQHSPGLYTPNRRAQRNRGGTDETIHPTLLHAALSSHLAAVARAEEAFPSARATARLVSIRKPTRIPRRPAHRCPRT